MSRRFDAPYAVRKAATELVIELFDCCDCGATTGELCWAQLPPALGAHGVMTVYRDWQYTHMSRIAGHGEPEAFLATHGRTVTP